MTSFIYSSIIRFLNFCLPIFSIKICGKNLFNEKYKEFYLGRKKNKELIENNNFEIFRSLTSSVIWFHCSSLGEFEQCRPLIEKIKARFTTHKIALTFFSPSGYSAVKKYSLVDWVGYIPLDITRHIDLIINFINPKIVVLSKNEFWPNMLYSLKKGKVPVLSISSEFKRDNIFWKPWAFWFKDALRTITHFYPANFNSQKILNHNGITNTTTLGDLRMDRVLDVLNEKKDFKILDDFTKNIPCWVAGSTWDEDYTLFIDSIHFSESLKVIIAPHDCSKKSISSLTSKLNIPFALWSKYSSKNDKSKKVLILDQIGVLKYAYRYANWCYVGGGMGHSGLHNILEAAVYDIPIIIGENYKKFPEANDLIKIGGCFSVSSNHEFNKISSKINKNLKFGRMINFKYIELNKGATDKIFWDLKKYL
tara:strand:- start:836 stop:2101 length:1266 start_codon:yes stop_codon:yes gene_type:complete